MMTKTEAKEIAKNTLLEALSVAYYRLEDEEYTDEEVEEICAYMNKYGKTMANAIKKNYFTM